MNKKVERIGLHFDTFDLAVTGKGQVRKLFRIGQSVCLHDTVRFGFLGSRAADGEYE